MEDLPNRIDRPEDRAVLREAAISIVRDLAEAGFTAYFAGGCVRDKLMGFEPEDYDVATSARPEQIRRVFPRAMAVGEAFGVMLVRRKGFTIEVATFRTDGVYSDGRHPDQVMFSDAEHDARRRDFTINGLFEDPLAGEIIDFVGGRADIEARVLRAIGEPEDRLREDRLRMLRAVRFAARFALAIESATADSIRKGAGQLEGVSRERIGLEIRKMLSDANRAVAAWELQYLGLDAIVLNEENCMAAPTRLGRLQDGMAYPVALAAWLLDRHEEGGIDPPLIATRWSGALMLSNAERDAFQRSLAIYATLRDDWTRLGVAGQKRLATDPEFVGGLALLQATDRVAFIDIRRRITELARTDLAPEPLIDGQDLIREGYRPGPAFRVVLDAVYDAQLEGTVQHKDEALRLARMIYQTTAS